MKKNIKTALLLIALSSITSCSLLGISNDKPRSNASATKTNSALQTAEDLRISTGIHVDLYCLDLFKPVDVKVKDGVVYYTGTVPSLKESYAASGIAWKQNGVKKVINNLTVGDKASPTAATWSSKKNVKN